jgi:methylated-DNA-[protein]-cysteine S-methyltransferase
VDDGFDAVTRQLGEYFARLGVREAGLDAADEDPYGETRTYGQLAADPGAAQAVGNANGWNPIRIIVPCHRVVGTGGGLTGYAGGLGRKRFLLSLEEPPAAASGRLF